MIKYRPQRGGFDEAMKEARTFETVEEMKSWIAENIRRTTGVELITTNDIIILNPADSSEYDQMNGWIRILKKPLLSSKYR